MDSLIPLFFFLISYTPILHGSIYVISSCHPLLNHGFLGVFNSNGPCHPKLSDVMVGSRNKFQEYSLVI